MISDKQRIASLEHELGLARAEIDRLRLRLDVGQVRGMVTEINDDVFAMPSDHQMRRLFDIVIGKYPAFAGANFDMVSGAFLALGYVRRSNILDSSRLNGSWTELVERWLRDHGRGQTIYVREFCLALVCHHDIPFACADRFASLTGLAFGLVYLGHASGSYPARDSWRKLLDGTVAVREPIVVPALRQDPNAVGPVKRSGIAVT